MNEIDLKSLFFSNLIITRHVRRQRRRFTTSTRSPTPEVNGAWRLPSFRSKVWRHRWSPTNILRTINNFPITFTTPWFNIWTKWEKWEILETGMDIYLREQVVEAAETTTKSSVVESLLNFFICFYITTTKTQKSIFIRWLF